MTGRSGQMRQTTTAEVRLDHGKAAGSGATRPSVSPFGCPRVGGDRISLRRASMMQTIAPTGRESGECRVQVFRNGCIEVVTIYSDPPQDTTGDLPSVGFESRIFRQIEHGKRMLQKLSVECPIAVMLSFVGIRGWRMGIPAGYVTSPLDVFDRDPLLIPEILIESFGHQTVPEVRPTIDAIWNAAGWPGSPHYDEKNQWDGNRF